jgi:hypothetical protein
MDVTFSASQLKLVKSIQAWCVDWRSIGNLLGVSPQVEFDTDWVAAFEAGPEAFTRRRWQSLLKSAVDYPQNERLRPVVQEASNPGTQSVVAIHEHAPTRVQQMHWLPVQRRLPAHCSSCRRKLSSYWWVRRSRGSRRRSGGRGVGGATPPAGMWFRHPRTGQ